MNPRIRRRPWVRNPLMRAMAPSAATPTARMRCVFSSPGTKCAKTEENEIRTGVAMQCTTQRAEAQIPRLSAERAEAREEVLIVSEKSFPLNFYWSSVARFKPWRPPVESPTHPPTASDNLPYSRLCRNFLATSHPLVRPWYKHGSTQPMIDTPANPLQQTHKSPRPFCLLQSDLSLKAYRLRKNRERSSADTRFADAPPSPPPPAPFAQSSAKSSRE
jgi:hypothetical protein